MSNYTHRPIEAFCTELNAELLSMFVAWADANNIPINFLMTSGRYNKLDRAMAWRDGELIGSAFNRYVETISLSDFIAKFKTPEPKETDAEKRERLIDELTERVGEPLKEINTYDIYESLLEIQSLKPKS